MRYLCLKKYFFIGVLSSISFTHTTFPAHLVSDLTGQALQNAELAEAVNIVKTGAEQIRAVMSVYNELKEVYDVIGNVRNTFNNLSSYWNSFQNQWSFDNIEDFDSFMSTADNKLGRWGIQPATSGVLGDAVARSKSLKYDAYDGASDIRNLPYDYSRDNVLRSLFSKTSYKKTTSSDSDWSFFGLFSSDSIEVEEVEDNQFASDESGIKVKTATGDLTVPTSAEKVELAQKVQQKVESDFLEYAQNQAVLDAATKANVAKIASNESGVYSSDLAGVTQQATDIAAINVAATADVTTAINQNTATNIKMNQLMMEMNQAESDLKEMEDYGALLE